MNTIEINKSFFMFIAGDIRVIRYTSKEKIEQVREIFFGRKKKIFVFHFYANTH